MYVLTYVHFQGSFDSENIVVFYSKKRVQLTASTAQPGDWKLLRANPLIDCGTSSYKQQENTWKILALNGESDVCV